LWRGNQGTSLGQSLQPNRAVYSPDTAIPRHNRRNQTSNRYTSSRATPFERGSARKLESEFAWFRCKGIPGTGRQDKCVKSPYLVSIDLAGNFTVNVKPDKRVSQAANAPRAFRGTIINAENIGKTSSELADMWDAEHPDDLIER
jgi:hypothetical protein